MTTFPGVDWTEYRDTINSAMGSMAQQPVTWRRYRRKMARFGEDGDITYDDIELRAIISYDDWRIWPYNRGTASGTMDYGHAALIFNKDYLFGLGFLNDEGYFNCDTGYDRFVVNGITYKSLGDTLMAQAGDDTVLLQMIIQREDLKTGNESGIL